MLAANKNAQQSKAFGCQFDLTGVSDAVSACTNVVNQYENALSGGAVEDFDATLAQFQQYVADGRIHYFLAESGGFGFGGSGSGTAAEIRAWVEKIFAAHTVDGTTVYDLTAPR